MSQLSAWCEQTYALLAALWSSATRTSRLICYSCQHDVSRLMPCWRCCGRARRVQAGWYVTVVSVVWADLRPVGGVVVERDAYKQADMLQLSAWCEQTYALLAALWSSATRTSRLICYSCQCGVSWLTPCWRRCGRARRVRAGCRPAPSRRLPDPASGPHSRDAAGQSARCSDTTWSHAQGRETSPRTGGREVTRGHATGHDGSGYRSGWSPFISSGNLSTCWQTRGHQGSHYRRMTLIGWWTRLKKKIHGGWQWQKQKILLDLLIALRR